MSADKTRILFASVLIRDLASKRLLLAQRSNGFGANKWNGIGGEIQPPESVQDCGKRLVRELVGLEVDALDYVGFIEYQVENKMNETIEMYILVADEYKGELAINERE